MKPSQTERRRFGRLFVFLACAYFIFATFELTPVHQKLGPLGVFGVDFFTPFVCIIAFFPMLGLLWVGHRFWGGPSIYRSTIYISTALFLLAILGYNLATSPPYDDDYPGCDFWTFFAGSVKALIAPPGINHPAEIDESDYFAPDALSVTFAFGVSVMLLILGLRDGWRHRLEKRSG